MALAGYTRLYADPDGPCDIWSVEALRDVSTLRTQPDLAIQCVTLLLQSRGRLWLLRDPTSEAELWGLACDAALAAVAAGPPLLRTGLQLLDTGLRILQGQFGSESLKRLPVDVALDEVHGWRLTVDPDKPLCVREIFADH